MSLLNDFNSSLRFDRRLYYEDIEGSIAHATMLGRCGIITPEDSRQIVAGLEQIANDISYGRLRFDNNAEDTSAEDTSAEDTSAEDIHMFIEAELTKRIGEAGKRLHTARSRNDQVAVDLRMYLDGEALVIIDLLNKLSGVLSALAYAHESTVMPGYTHLQRAQPVSFANHLRAYDEMFSRDKDRLFCVSERINSQCPLGSCALAGTTYRVNREMTAELLGFDAPCENTLDGVSDRDFVIELASALAMIMMHLSRFSEEIILWCSQEWNFIKLHNDYCTGSSIMPQKRNPDVAELVRGKSGRVFGNLQALLVIMKGLPLAYNKDMQEVQEAIYDSVDTVKACLSIFTPMIESMEVNGESMREAVTKGYLNATELADYLVGKGLPFRDAYGITKEIVNFCKEKGLELS
jgi:argininosuccinate lyase